MKLFVIFFIFCYIQDLESVSAPFLFLHSLLPKPPPPPPLLPPKKKCCLPLLKCCLPLPIRCALAPCLPAPTPAPTTKAPATTTTVPTTTTKPPKCVLTVEGKCVDVIGGSSASGTQLDINTCNQTPTQNWVVEGDGTIRSVGKCMDVRDGRTDNTAIIQLADCTGAQSQQWVFLSTGQLSNPVSNRCLDVNAGIIQDGQPLILYDCKEPDNSANQVFVSMCEPS